MDEIEHQVPLERAREPIRWQFRPRDAQTLSVVLTIALTFLAVDFRLHHRRDHAWVAIDDAPQLTHRHQVDLNQCDWPALCVLPGIRETLARRTVQDRINRHPFREPED